MNTPGDGIALGRALGVEVATSRREAILGGASLLTAAALPSETFAEASVSDPIQSDHSGAQKMNTITTKDGVSIYYKNWGHGQPVVFSHGWPLSSDDWDGQMMFFLNHGYRVIAHDRRGHGRSSQTAVGHDMDHYADDLAALTAHLNLKDAIHVGHSTGGGEVAHYIARHGTNRVAKAVLISSVPPLMVKTANNPGGLDKSVFDGIQASLAANRAQFYRDFASGPFYGFNRPGAKVLDGVIQNWWRQGMMGGIKAHYDGVVAFSQTDFTPDLKKIAVPTLVMHGEDDQVVPINDSSVLTAKLVKGAKLITYKGFPHGMCTTEGPTINRDLLEFLRS
jgi:non-heme chloroperoxidase